MEQVIIEILYFLLRNVYQILSTYTCVFSMLTPKYKRAYILIIGLTLINFSGEAITDPSWITFRMVCNVSLIFLPAMLFFKEKKIICFFAGGLLIALLMLLDVTGSYLASLIFGAFLTVRGETHTWNTILYVIGTDIYFTAFFILLVSLWNKFFKKANTKSIALFALFPVSQFLFFCACSYQTWYISRMDLFENPFMLVSILLSLVADIAMCRALMQNTKTHELSQKLSDMQHQMELQLQYYDGLADKMQQVREYRHDINNLIEVTESLLRSSTSTEDGRILLEEIKVKTANAKIPVFSSNPTVNAVLYHKQSSARELGVEFRVEMEVSEDFPFERSDICSVFANLLDNALREAAGCANGFTEVSAKRSMGLLKIEVRNSTEKNLDLGREKPSTDKPEPGKHGYGLEIVESIARKYDGKFVLTAENGIARAAVSLPLSMSSVNENALQKGNAFSLSESN